MYAGGFAHITPSCQTAKKPTMTNVTLRPRHAPEDCSVPDMRAPQQAKAFEYLANGRDIPPELARLANGERARARQVDRQGVDDPPRRPRHDDDAVGEKHGLRNAVSDEQHGLGVA